MPNHVHLLIRAREEGDVSKFMQKLMTGYTMYFNMRHERSGALFQGKFKATHVDTDRYLRYLISYIHLNPIKLIEPRWKDTGIGNRKRAERYLGKYAYSSYLDYVGRVRPANALLEQVALPEYFGAGAGFKTFVTEWLDYHPE
jgi:putative transposase